MTGRKSWDHGGETAERRGYGRRHAQMRATLLAREPLCRLCQAKHPPRVTVATIADHITSLAKGGKAYDYNNLQPVCGPCHERKTLEEQGKRYRRATALDGWPTDD